MTDSIPLIKEVLYVGEHFTLMTSVVIMESLRLEGESDDELAVRLASKGLQGYYGWNVQEMATDIAIVE